MSQRIVDTKKGPCSCAGTNDDHDYPSDPDEAGCTDVFCLLFFAVYWVGILGVGVASISTGDLAALWYGADYLGNRCGVGLMEEKKDVWWVSPFFFAWPTPLRRHLARIGDAAAPT